MREIKFRQWLGDHFEYWGVNLDEYRQFVGPMSCHKMNAGNTVHQQFTGMLDKNGNEIYEGDIAQLNGMVRTVTVVVWEDCGFAFRAEGIKSPLSLSIWGPTCEIIGNIYENQGKPRD